MKHAHEAIVSEEDWEAVQEELTRRVLEEVLAHDRKTFTIRFLDGTEKRISL